MDIYRKEAASIDIGDRIRQLRKDRKLSLRALSRISSLSANALSMIERGKVSPSVSTLYKIAEALKLPITAFFLESPQHQKVVFQKASKRNRIPFERGLWEGLGGEFFVGRVEPFMLTLERGAGSGSHGMVHTGHEFVMCLRGHLEYIVENKKYALEPGDSLLFSSHLKHSWRNTGNTVTNAIFVLAGFEESDRVGPTHILDHAQSSLPESDIHDSDEVDPSMFSNPS